MRRGAQVRRGRGAWVINRGRRMASPAGKKVLLFQSPNMSAGETDPFPANALLSTDTAQKAEQYRCATTDTHSQQYLIWPIAGMLLLSRSCARANTHMLAMSL